MHLGLAQDEREEGSFRFGRVTMVDVDEGQSCFSDFPKSWIETGNIGKLRKTRAIWFYCASTHFGFCLLQCGSSPGTLMRQHGRLGRNVECQSVLSFICWVSQHASWPQNGCGCTLSSQQTTFFPLFQMWHGFILHHKYQLLYNTPTSLHACFYLIVRNFLNVLNL